MAVPSFGKLQFVNVVQQLYGCIPKTNRPLIHCLKCRVVFIRLCVEIEFDGDLLTVENQGDVQRVVFSPDLSDQSPFSDRPSDVRQGGIIRES